MTAPLEDLTENRPLSATATRVVPICRPDLPELRDYTDLMEEVWETQMLSNFGPLSRRLEREASQYLGGVHVRATASGDVGLMAVIKALGLKPGAPCFISPFTFNSTINTALWNQLRPIYVDIDTATYNMSPHALAEAVDNEPQPGLVLATHVFGAPCDVESLASLASSGGHFLIFDAAHGLGAQHSGAMVGTFGDAEMFSLSGTKPVTSAEGGLISTRHDWLLDRFERVRGYGFKDDYRSDIVGVNGKMSELHAGLGLLNLRRIDSILGVRDDHVAQYKSRLGGLVGWQHVREGDRSTTKDLAIHLGKRRARVELALRTAGVQTKRYFVPLHYMSAYASFSDGPLPGAEGAYEESLCIPLFGAMSPDDIDYVCDVIIASLD